MFNGYDFVFDGKSSISENIKLLYTDNSSFEDVQGIPEKNYSLFKTNQNSKWNISGVNHEEPLKFDIQIMLHGEGEDEYKRINPIMPRNQISRISHWLFDNVGFKKLQILNDDMRDLYFMCVFQSPEYLLNGGEIIGFKATVLCDTVGAYEEKTIIKTSSGNMQFSIQCQQDGIYEVSPVYTIQMLDSDVKITVNTDEIILKSLTVGSTVTIDTERLITNSSENDNLYVGDRFNKCFPNFKWGKNIIAIEGKCKLTIKYKMIREVGC